MIQPFSTASKYSFEEVAHIFWSMRDSIGEESALAVLNAFATNPFERLALILDLMRYGERALKEEVEKGKQA